MYSSVPLSLQSGWPCFGHLVHYPGRVSEGNLQTMVKLIDNGMCNHSCMLCALLLSHAVHVQLSVHLQLFKTHNTRLQQQKGKLSWMQRIAFKFLWLLCTGTVLSTVTCIYVNNIVDRWVGLHSSPMRYWSFRDSTLPFKISGCLVLGSCPQSCPGDVRIILSEKMCLHKTENTLSSNLNADMIADHVISAATIQGWWQFMGGVVQFKVELCVTNTIPAPLKWCWVLSAEESL